MSDESLSGNTGDYDNRKRSPGLLYKQREKRVNDAIELKIPDRVPILVGFGFFAAKYAGFTC
jgi:hypothetical protein